jgi:arabinogalactan oligomer / maltooligosaccharide transport system permease protein
LSTRSRQRILLTLALLLAFSEEAVSEPLRLWHAYRGAEQDALQAVTQRWNSENEGREVVLLSVPYDAFANKLTSAIPRGHGPDLFIAAHERAGDWARTGLIEAWEDEDAEPDLYHPTTVEAVRVTGRIYGVPLAYKSLVLFYNPEMVEKPPETTDEMIAIGAANTDAASGRYGLVYEATNFYLHAPWLLGHGGEIIGDEGEIILDSPENAASLAFVDRIVNQLQIVPEETTAVLVSQLFNEGRAAMVINGPWFLAEVDKATPLAIAPLPRVSSTGKAATPLLTVDVAYVSARSARIGAAREFARFLGAPASAVTRARMGHQPVATLAAYQDAEVASDPHLRMFRRQLDAAKPMSTDPRMRSVWEPANQALRQVLRGANTPALALAQAQRRIEILTRPPPLAVDWRPLAVGLSLVLLAFSIWFFLWSRRTRLIARMRRNAYAYFYLLPALVAMTALVFVPFAVGSAVSLFAHRQGEFTFVGLANFAQILFGQDYGPTDPMSFYFTFGVTVLWTATNVFLHVAVGLALALVLREPWLRLRGIYRVLLIIPWAVPNYITALIWKGMFHRQFGAINGLLVWLGLEPVAWFSQFSTAFAANLATNVWLGFPFMMVVCLGALQAIPRDLEEAAEVDGASMWQRFRHVTFPLLRPALVPAVVVGTVWTFNMFNIIYLVSAGEPDGATEIMISEAYKWAFSRQEQYGYAASYALLIFFVLLVYSACTGQLDSGES